jgi:hypothetical protein
MYFTVHLKAFSVFLFQVYCEFGNFHSVVSHQFRMTNVIVDSYLALMPLTSI